MSVLETNSSTWSKRRSRQVRQHGRFRHVRRKTAQERRLRRQEKLWVLLAVLPRVDVAMPSDVAKMQQQSKGRRSAQVAPCHGWYDRLKTKPAPHSFQLMEIMSNHVVNHHIGSLFCHHPSSFLSIVFTGILVSVLPAYAGESPDPESSTDGAVATGTQLAKSEDSPADNVPQPLGELEVKCDKTDGMLEFWRDRETGEVYMIVGAEQLDKPLIYFTYTESGLTRFFLGRGVFRNERILQVTRDYHRLRFRFEPTRYHFDPQSPLRFAAEANVSPAVVAAEKIVAWDEPRTRFAVSADKLFLSEAWDQLKPAEDKSKSKPKQFRLGELSADKSRFVELRGYPKNVDIVVDYVYQNLSPAHHADKDEGVTDSRYVTVTVQHSIIEAPDNDYQPRRDDPRVGYFSQQVDDMTSASATPYRDVIRRWHLKRTNGDTPRGPPETPIVWWLERTTPHEFRDTIRDAVLAWNEAFEQAGFDNAVEVRIQPDDTDWNAGDIRYNVIRWTSSPAPVFGGYGPSFVDPRTGQILGADIMLEWVFVTNRVRYRELFRRTSSLADSHFFASGCERGCLCNLSDEMQVANLFGRQVLALRGALAVEQDELLKQALYYLVLHEVGHTLGLTHNFKASQLHSLEQIHERETTAAQGLTSSVMDYPNINVAPLDRAQGMYYTTRPGAYDKWAIEYGYSPGVEDSAAEQERLDEILLRSTQPELAYANDADDMRRPGRGIDPGAMIYDLTSDPVGWAEERMGLIRQLAAGLLENYQQSGQSYQELRDRYAVLLRQFKTAANVVARYPGGVRVDRSFVGQAGAQQPLQPVGREQQKRAVHVLATHVFAPDAWVPSPALLAHLQKQRRGFDHFEENEDLKIHDQILNLHQVLFDQLLHRDVLKRITDTGLYGNGYPLDEYLSELTAAVLQADANGDVHTIRQNLQTEYVRRLIGIFGDQGTSQRSGESKNLDHSFDTIAQSSAFDQLYQIQGQIERSLNGGGDAATSAHRRHLKWMIQKALEL